MADDAWMAFLNVAGRPLPEGLGRRIESQEAEEFGRVLVLCASAERVAAMDSGLWTYDQASFLAHGAEGDGGADDHPVWVTESEPGGAFSQIVVVDDAAPADWSAYGSRAYLFDAQDPTARDLARMRWRAWSDEGKSLEYWSFDGAEWRLERRS